MNKWPSLTIPIRVVKMITAKEKKAMKAFTLISGCRFWNSFARNRPPIMNIKAVSMGGEGGGR